MIFDKDGTLIELYHYWSQMVALRARLIREALGLGMEHESGLRWALGVDERAGRLRPEGPVGLKKREIVIKAGTDYLDGIGHRDTLRLCGQAFERADEISSAELGRFIRPIRGAVSLMAALHDRGCRVALATVDVSRRARLAMEFMGVNDTLDLIVGGEEVARSKPDPEMIHIILDRLGVDRIAGRHGRGCPQRRSDGRECRPHGIHRRAHGLRQRRADANPHPFHCPGRGGDCRAFAKWLE